MKIKKQKNQNNNYQIIILSFILALPFWWSINLLEGELENIFYWKQLSDNPEIMAADLLTTKELRDSKPTRNNQISDFQTDAKAVFSLYIPESGEEKVMFDKNSQDILPMASISKLMTANVVLKYYDLNKNITVSKEAVNQEEDFGRLQAGKTFPVSYLLYPLLMESSNDAAFALADDYEGMSVSKFVSLMNWEAENLNLNNTNFYNPSGLDPEDNKSKDKINTSTAKDIATLTENLLDKDVIWDILTTDIYSEYGPVLENTDKLLGVIPGIVGGKTGYTEEAGQCMVLVIKAPKSKGYLINVILGSSDRFGEMENLVNWLRQAYNW